MNDLCQWNERARRLTWRDVVRWNHRDLCRLGIDHLNLLACKDLPGAEQLNLTYCLSKIDEWTQVVKNYTENNVYQFRKWPERFGRSIGYFKALCLVTSMQLECGIHYRQDKKDRNAIFEPADSFIFGAIQGVGGTCASLPVLYCAVGHRLGYPMSLVRTKAHCFVCWDDGTIRFNLEGSTEGMATPTDEHFRTGLFATTPEEERIACFLKRKDMRQSFALFLAERSLHCLENQLYKEAVDSMAWAAALHPENKTFFESAKHAYNQWLRFSNLRKPPGFPSIEVVELKARRFVPTIPLEFELDLCGLETQECLLNDKELDSALWNPLRQGDRLSGIPRRVDVSVDEKCGKSIRFVH